MYGVPSAVTSARPRYRTGTCASDQDTTAVDLKTAARIPHLRARQRNRDLLDALTLDICLDIDLDARGRRPSHFLTFASGRPARCPWWLRCRTPARDT